MQDNSIPFEVLQQCYDDLCYIYDNESLARFDSCVLTQHAAMEEAFSNLSEGEENSVKRVDTFYNSAQSMVNSLKLHKKFPDESPAKKSFDACEKACLKYSGWEKGLVLLVERENIPISDTEKWLAVPENKAALDKYHKESVERTYQRFLEQQALEEKNKICTRFSNFWKDNPKLTARIPHLFWPIPVSIGLTYLASLVYDVCSHSSSIDAVNKFFSSRLRDASSLEMLKTPGAIYGLATLLAVAVCVGACYWCSKKQPKEQKYIPQQKLNEKNEICSRFSNFRKDNPKLVARIPHLLWPIPVSIGLTYLASLVYDVCYHASSIDTVNKFFNSRLRDASSFEMLKTPGAIYGLATLLAVAVCVSACCWCSKKQPKEQKYTPILDNRIVGGTSHNK